MSDGGKGSAPRKQQDHEAYSSNYDVIFNRHKRLKSDEVIDKTYKDIKDGVQSVPWALKDWSYEEKKEEYENRTGHRNDNGSQDDPRSGNEGH